MTAPDHRVGLLDIVRAIKAGTRNPQTYIDESHSRAAARESGLRAYSHLPKTPPRAAIGGPLSGVAIGVKDIIETADMPTTYGSAAYVDHQPLHDAWVVERLRTLGAAILGKTVSTEFAWREAGPTRNPWNSAHTPGGSSSGSAATVGGGAAQAALGSQTLGSIIRPAAYCGAVGLKPSFGTISLQGVHPLSQSLDHLGLFATGVDDAAYLLTLLAGGPGASRPATLGFDVNGVMPFEKPRLALVFPDGAPPLDPSQRDLLDSTAKRLVQAGATVTSLALPAPFAALASINATLCAAEAASNFGALVSSHPDKTSTKLKELVARGAGVSATDYIAARREQLRLRESFAAAIADFDAVITAPAIGEAPEGLSDTGDPGWCVPWTTLGVPAITLPAGFGPRGLPLGVQFVAAYGEDSKLLRIAKWSEVIRGSHH